MTRFVRYILMFGSFVNKFEPEHIFCQIKNLDSVRFIRKTKLDLFTSNSIRLIVNRIMTSYNFA